MRRVPSLLHHPKIRYGDHLPVLIQAVTRTSGPIVELGGGFYSTPYLHWACFNKNRPLATYDNEPTFANFLSAFQTDYHKVQLVEDWDTIDLSGPISVAFVDHAPAERRIMDMRRLLHAEYVVAHDTEERRNHHYRWDLIHDLFKYRYRYRSRLHGTSVFSNVHDVSRIME
jgi:hypothetical protein